MEACCDVSCSVDKWLSRVTVSSWLTHVKEVLNCACLVAQVRRLALNASVQYSIFPDGGQRIVLSISSRQ